MQFLPVQMDLLHSVSGHHLEMIDVSDANG